MKTTTTLFSAIIMMVSIFTSSASFAAVKTENAKTTNEVNAGALKTNMQQLWENHVTLTRDVIFCIVDGQPGIDAARDRLVANQSEIANNFQLYYGKKAGLTLNMLLYQNITLSADVMIASRNGNNSAFDKADKKWKENTNALLAFLSQTNPFWNGQAINKILYAQVQFTTDEINTVKNKDYIGAATTYDKAIGTASLMATTLSDGIVDQFPAKFQDLTTPLLGQK